MKIPLEDVVTRGELVGVETLGMSLHYDCQLAAIVWAKLLPSWSGSVVCPSSPHIDPGVMRRSLALIHSASPFVDPISADDILEVLEAYEDDLINWEDALTMLRTVLR